MDFHKLEVHVNSINLVKYSLEDSRFYCLKDQQLLNELILGLNQGFKINYYSKHPNTRVTFT